VSHRSRVRQGKKLWRRGSGKTDVDGDGRLRDDLHNKVETCKDDECKKLVILCQNKAMGLTFVKNSPLHIQKCTEQSLQC
jgi:hypothetical protein